MLFLILIIPIKSYSLTYTPLEYELTNSFTTTNNEDAYLNVTIDDINDVMTIEYDTLLDKDYYIIKITCYELDTSGTNQIAVKYADTCWSSGVITMDNHSFMESINFEDIDLSITEYLDSPYKILINTYILNDPGEELNNNNNITKGLELKFNDGVPGIVIYDKCSTQNASIRDKGNTSTISPNAFLDVTLGTESYYEDGQYVLTTDTQVNSIKALSNSLSSGCENDYDKLLAFYNWITEYTYYDYDGRAAGNVEVNPYRLYQQFLNSGGNSDGTCDTYINGRPSASMKTYCNGYSVMLIALSRAQGIPARMVSGHSIAPVWDVWEDEDFTDIDHHWVEAYVNGNWIVIDANAGTSNRFEDSTYKYCGTSRYTNFDMTDECLTNAHYYIEYARSTLDIEFLTASNDVNHLKSYLTGKNSYGYIRGTLINSNFNAEDKSTWTDNDNYKMSSYQYGNLKTMFISGAGLDKEDRLGGYLDLSNSEGLLYASLSSQELTGVNLRGCENLVTLYCSWNKIPSLNLSESYNLTYFSCTHNPTNYIKYRDASNKLITLSAWRGGYIEGIYSNGYLTINASPLPGYKTLGIYNSSGYRLTSNDTYTFKPTGTLYTTRYTVTTSGYPGYTLKLGSNIGSTRENCNKSIETRLKQLGYFTLTPNTYFGTATRDAVKAFQAANGIKMTGEVNSYTWSKLYSTSCKSMTNASFYKTLDVGYSGTKAYLVEYRLKQLGYFSYTPNTYYGTATRDAVKAFQANNGISLTGRITSYTWGKIFSSKAKSITNASFYKELKIGYYGTKNYLAEFRLKQLGYFKYTVNYYYGTATRDAVKGFQADKGLEVTGIIDETTWNSLF